MKAGRGEFYWVKVGGGELVWVKDGGGRRDWVREGSVRGLREAGGIQRDSGRRVSAAHDRAETT